MNKNVLAVFAAVCGLFMISCDTPKDDRPSAKASVDYVQPGARSTNNVSDMGGEVHTAQSPSHGTDKIMPAHDTGGNTIQPGDSVRGSEVTTEAGADKL
ncbi:hypothetical protein K3G39_14045 [Pontibacter sp. HSC-14F20]|uniref:hypothetical protein n=1 Tax=Pontibacter sp. HSC-14F20 TaxID=2864136 RepID=UPI001C72CDDA|nr:hypothetical protein [Pontibacter sp. HSC-14F20]MBX0334360.1 hypothetical protein [Pontibacter sp. HSC-14F20]